MRCASRGKREVCIQGAVWGLHPGGSVGSASRGQREVCNQGSVRLGGARAHLSRTVLVRAERRGEVLVRAERRGEGLFSPPGSGLAIDVGKAGEVL